MTRISLVISFNLVIYVGIRLSLSHTHYRRPMYIYYDEDIDSEFKRSRLEE